MVGRFLVVLTSHVRIWDIPASGVQPEAGSYPEDEHHPCAHASLPCGEHRSVPGTSITLTLSSGVALRAILRDALATVARDLDGTLVADLAVAALRGATQVSVAGQHGLREEWISRRWTASSEPAHEHAAPATAGLERGHGRILARAAPKRFVMC